MNKVVAIMRRTKLDVVKYALDEIGHPSMAITEASRSFFDVAWYQSPLTKHKS